MNVGDVLGVLAQVELPSGASYRLERVKTGGGTAVQIVFDTGRSVRFMTLHASAIRPLGDGLVAAADGVRYHEGTIRTHGFRVRVSDEGMLTILADDATQGGRLSLPIWKLEELLLALQAAKTEFLR